MTGVAAVTGTNGRPAPQALRYDAFVSYNHVDRELAPAFRRTLHGIARPWNRRSAVRVFVDNSELGQEPSLPASIESALDRSRYLVVLACPESARSAWVEREIQHWLDTGRPVDDILLVLTGGEPPTWDGDARAFRGDAVPEVLRQAIRVERRWVDLRWVGHRARPAEHARFRDSVADVAATLHGVPKDDLVGEDLRVRRRNRRLARSSIFALTVLTLVAASIAVYAVVQRDEARRQTANAVSQRTAEVADRLRAGDPALAAQLGLAAFRVSATSEARSSVLSTLSAPVGTRMLAHSAPITGIVSDASGRLVVSAGLDDRMVVTRLDDAGRAHRASVTTLGLGGSAGLAIRPAGDVVATGGLEGRILLWDIRRPERPVRLSSMTTGQGLLTSVAFSPGGTLMASAGSAHEVRLWDISDPTRPATRVRLPVDRRVSKLAFDGSGRVLVAGGSTGGVVVISLRGEGRAVSAAVATTMAPSPAGDQMLAMTPGGDVFLTHDGTMPELWRMTRPPRSVAVYPQAHWARLMSLATTADGRMMATGGQDHLAVVWQDGNPVATLRHPLRVTALTFGSAGRVLVTGSDDGALRVWRLFDITAAARPDSPVVLVGVAGARDDGIGVDVVSAESAGPVLLWRRTPDGLRPAGRMPVPYRREVSLALRDDGRMLALSTGDSLSLWDLSDPARPRRTGTIASTGIVSVVFGGDGRHVVTGHDQGVIRTWRTDDPGQLTQDHEFRTLPGADPIWSVAMNQAGDVVVGGTTRAVLVWSLATPDAPPEILAGADDLAAAVTFSRDGRLLAAAGPRHTVRVWDLAAFPDALPTEVGTMSGHTDGVLGLAIAPDGRTLVSAGRDATVRIWDITDPRGSRSRAVVTLPREVAGLGFERDGHTLVVGDAALRLVETDVGQAMRRVCTVSGDGLTRAEWAEYVPEYRYEPPC